MSEQQPDGSHLAADAVGERARQLFRYLGGEEWRDYRAILQLFAGTFFAEFTPDDVIAATQGMGVDPQVVGDRLESLRRWGNLTVSSTVGNPSSLDDYYRRRSRYLITREGQEVFELVERVLAGIDEIGDVNAGRLRELDRGLVRVLELCAPGISRADPNALADAVRTVFDLHEQFTTELTQFFAELNQWQSRYDLRADEVQFFAGVLVDYVSEQLTEIERMTRPIAQHLRQLAPDLDELVAGLHTGLAARVDDAGLAEQVTVRRQPGTRRDDWDHLAQWFEPVAGRRARLDQLTDQAIAAVRTLTANLTRLSRSGLGGASRRADFVKLARFLDVATTDEAHVLMTAAFGLTSCRHLSALSADVEDPVATITPWSTAPRAAVPVALRERGEIGQRGKVTPIRDRSLEREMLRRRREYERVTQQRIVDELLSACAADGSIDGASLSPAAFAHLRSLIGRSTHVGRRGGEDRMVTDAWLHCAVRRVDDATTAVSSPEGTLMMYGVEVRLRRIRADADDVVANDVITNDVVAHDVITNDVVAKDVVEVAGAKT